MADWVLWVVGWVLWVADWVLWVRVVAWPGVSLPLAPSSVLPSDLLLLLTLTSNRVNKFLGYARMPRINPARLTEILEKILAEIEEAYELSKNNELTDILERVRGKITIILLTLSDL